MRRVVLRCHCRSNRIGNPLATGMRLTDPCNAEPSGPADVMECLALRDKGHASIVKLLRAPKVLSWHALHMLHEVPCLAHVP